MVSGKASAKSDPLLCEYRFGSLQLYLAVMKANSGKNCPVPQGTTRTLFLLKDKL